MLKIYVKLKNIILVYRNFTSYFDHMAEILQSVINKKNQSLSPFSGDRVDEYVFISGYIKACDEAFIRKNNITRVLKLFKDTFDYPGGAYRHPGVYYMIVPAEDRSDFLIEKYFADCYQFIKKGLSNNERILIHCHAGVSRAATIVLMYLMTIQNFTLKDAYYHLKKIRPVINPNSGFIHQLEKLENKMIESEKKKHNTSKKNSKKKVTFA